MRPLRDAEKRPPTYPVAPVSIHGGVMNLVVLRIMTVSITSMTQFPHYCHSVC